MIINARLSRVDLPSGADASGDRSWSTGEAISVRCAVGAPTRTRTVALGQLIKDATAVLYVAQAPAGSVPVDGALLRFTIDGRTEKVMEAIKVVDWVHDGLSGFEVFLKEQ